ncbi:alpha/beta hydrolase [Pseudorhodobacter sp. E13]|uniref:alpha/beta hydrolase n=1 Tax=Pseudorhodobacter sp. E13 TaxID=2487931 RepID=UPI000F8D4CB3|nr:alpha/beta hydrolase [Pseudorhodobacter sp. E13]RUS63370.1 alpha/beta hydrolase [Pseudorhodobacter sp. E13]
MAAQVDPTAKTAAYRFVKAIPDTVTGLRMMHLMAYATGWKVPKGMINQRVQVPRRGGGTIRTEVLRPKQAEGRLPILLHLHGGGYAIGTPQQDYALFARLMATRPCVIIAPHYRRALQAAFSAALDDCRDVLHWAAQHAEQLGGSADQIMVMGQSAGGGLAAALCLLVRDQGGPRIACQFPIAAMLDDRCTGTGADPSTLTWSLAKNRLAWGLYLGGGAASAYAAPARAADLSGLPPAVGMVGDCDLFCPENTLYFDRLRAAGVATAFQITPGAYHGAEVFAPRSAPGQRALAYLCARFAEAVDGKLG